MATVHKNAMRGLTTFIADLRNCNSKEKEESRVNKELAKIRKAFKEAKGDGYEKRKYVSKILYMYMLGYEIDFGYMEAVNLLSAPKFQEKSVGYLALSMLLSENHEMLPLIIQSLQNDLQSRVEAHQTLALTAVGNIGGKEISDALSPIIAKMLIAKSSPPPVKKKAALCMLRLFRKYPEVIAPEAGWDSKLNLVLDDSDIGVVNSTMSLCIGIVHNQLDSKIIDAFQSLVKRVVIILTRVVVNHEYPKEYIYYEIGNPWLQCKLLRFLSYYPPPPEKQVYARLTDILKKMLSVAEVAKGKSFNHKNALNCVLFEAIRLIIHYDDDRELMSGAISLLGKYLGAKETNMRYMALEAMKDLSSTQDAEAIALLRRHQETILAALRDADISIRKRALDVLFSMCDRNSSKSIVADLLTYLETADFAIREELVLKISILAADWVGADHDWYVDVILQLIRMAGDFVNDAIWWKVIHIVTAQESVQTYAAKTVFLALAGQVNPHETLVKVAAYILGEFGHLISDKPEFGAVAQFNLLHSKFAASSNASKALLFSTYVKMFNLFPEELTLKAREVFKSYRASLDTELQQRACEYLALTYQNEVLVQKVLDVMPAFPERGASIGQDTDIDRDEAPELSRVHQSGGASSAPASSTASQKSAASSTKSSRNLLDDDFANPGSAPAPAQSAAPLSGHGVSGISPSLDQLLFGSSGPQASSGLPPSSGAAFNPALAGGNASLASRPANSNPFGNSAGSAFNQVSAAPVPASTGIGSSMFGPGGAAPGIGSGLAPSSAVPGSGQDVLNKLLAGSSASGALQNALSPALAPQVHVSDADKLRALLGSEGVIFKDDIIQIGFKSEHSKNLGRMMIYYGNNQPFPITAFNVVIRQHSAVQIQAAPVPEVITPRQQVTQLLQMNAVSEFSEAPEMLISFTCAGKSYNLTFKLPILVTKFVEPMKINGPEFFQRWNGLGLAVEQQKVFNIQKPVSIPAVQSLVSQALHLGVLHGVDPNNNNLVCAGCFHSATNQIPILFRIESNPSAQAFRVTVRCSSPSISNALLSFFGQLV
eukprot:TRINITY_DN2199_c2_g1_i1.p1 TRINITY_DN2199_c2_g1~~TRINITY_DN2199_c2_g1_i1.p1  ORF type:complete len:1056 (-),score=242.90 TRINITY_DN2199_c2_g1_i1:162-3329(-)